jgi:hypothetical protein
MNIETNADEWYDFMTWKKNLKNSGVFIYRSSYPDRVEYVYGETDVVKSLTEANASLVEEVNKLDARILELRTPSETPPRKKLFGIF